MDWLIVLGVPFLVSSLVAFALVRVRKDKGHG